MSWDALSGCGVALFCGLYHATPLVVLTHGRELVFGDLRSTPDDEVEEDYCLASFSLLTSPYLDIWLRFLRSYPVMHDCVAPFAAHKSERAHHPLPKSVVNFVAVVARTALSADSSVDCLVVVYFLHCELLQHVLLPYFVVVWMTS